MSMKKKLQEAFLNGYNFGRFVIISDVNSGAINFGYQYKPSKGISKSGIKHMPDEFNYPK